MAGLMPLFYLFVAIRAAVEGGPTHLSGSLVPAVLVFGVVNVVGAAFIFRPIDKFLVNSGGIAFPEKWIIIGVAKANGGTPPFRVHASRETGQECEHKGLEGSAQARKRCGLPMARPATYLDVMARTGGHAAKRLAGARWLGVGGYGAALCAPGSGSSRGICGAFVATPRDWWHKSGTPAKW
jgi:hypothetical protein